MVVGTLLTYLLGTLWYSHIMELPFIVALSGAVLPFVIVDCIKIAIATGLSIPLKNRLEKSRMAAI